jgi:hypothetical protein
MQVMCQQFQRLFQHPRAEPVLKPAVAGLIRRILLGQLTPLRARSQHPEHPVHYRARVVPGAATVIRPTFRLQVGGRVIHPEFRDSEIRYRKDGALYRCRHYRAGMRNTVTE